MKIRCKIKLHRWKKEKKYRWFCVDCGIFQTGSRVRKFILSAKIRFKYHVFSILGIKVDCVGKRSWFGYEYYPKNSASYIMKYAETRNNNKK